MEFTSDQCGFDLDRETACKTKKRVNFQESTGVGTADVMRGVNDLKYFLKYFLDCGICCTILSSLPLQHYINSVGG